MNSAIPIDKTPTMQCHYCQQTIKRNSLESASSTQLENYLCLTCHVDYCFLNGDASSINLFGIYVGQKTYMVTFYLATRETWLFRLNKQDLRYYGFQKFDHIINWTPTNARGKLKLLLPFL